MLHASIFVIFDAPRRFISLLIDDFISLRHSIHVIRRF